MTAVTVSPKYQVVIPKLAREALGIAAGQKLEVIVHGNSVELVPVQPMSALRGFLVGMDPTPERDDDRL